MNNYNTRISELKGYGILLVVMGHAFVSSDQGYSIRNFIYLFHLAIFYYSSGYLFNDKYSEDPICYVKKRIKTLYVPYVLYGSIFILLHNLCCKIGLYSIDLVYKKGELVQHLFSLIKFNYFEALTGVFWFFKSLFIVCIAFEILAFISHKLKPHRVLALVLGGTILSAIGIAGCYVNFPCSRTFANLSLLPIFMGGYCINQRKLSIDNKWMNVLLPICCLLILLFNSNYSVSINAQDIGYNPFIFYFCAASGICLTLFIVDWTPKRLKGVVAYMGNNSFAIFIWHFLFFRLASYVIVIVNKFDIRLLSSHPVIHEKNIIWTIFYIIVGVGGSLLLGRIIQAAKDFILNK